MPTAAEAMYPGGPKQELGNKSFEQHLEDNRNETMIPLDKFDVHKQIDKDAETSVLDMKNRFTKPHYDQAKKQVKDIIDRFKAGEPEVVEAVNQFERDYKNPKEYISGKEFNRSTAWELFVDASQRNMTKRLTDEENGPQFGSDEYKTLSDESQGEKPQFRFNWDAVKVK